MSNLSYVIFTLLKTVQHRDDSLPKYSYILDEMDKDEIKQVGNSCYSIWVPWKNDNGELLMVYAVPYLENVSILTRYVNAEGITDIGTSLYKGIKVW